jgi:hypothetical protein
VDQLLSTLREVFLLGSKISWPVHAVRIDARPHDGETISDAIVRTRREIAAAQHEVRAVRALPPSREELINQLIDEIAGMAAAGKPRFDLRDGKLRVHWPDVVSLAPKGTVVSAPSGSSSRLLCWLMGEEVIKRLGHELLDNLPDGISAEERKTRIAECEASIMRLEHEEESLIEQALDAGIEVHRRVTASAYAMLSIEADAEVPVLQAAE